MKQIFATIAGLFVILAIAVHPLFAALALIASLASIDFIVND